MSPALAIDGPLTPEQSLTHLKTEPGLKVELVAAEPMVVSPVAVAWDEKGRMFVVEDRGYPTGPGPGKPPIGQVVMLENTKGNGTYDKRTVYADGLTFPNGVLPWNGGIYVTCAPYLYYFKDTKGDGKVDVKQIVFKGFQDLTTTQLRVSHPTLNLDNWIYLTSGLTEAKVVSPAHTNRPAVFLDRVDARFRPGTDTLEPVAGTAQFGQTFDRFGRKFVCSNRNHIQQVVMQLRYLKRNPNLSFSEVVEDIPDHEAACRLYPLSANITTAAFHAGYFTSACGVTIFGGTALPDAYAGNSFTCEPAGNLVHRDVLVPNGVTYIAKRAYPTNEFLASPDNWFRPVNLANGPDGALYICDMYRKTIEHPDYLPEATRKLTDFESGKGMGRIYRVVEDRKSRVRGPKSKVQNQKPDLSKLSVKDLVAELNNPDVWWRMTAQRLLLELPSAKKGPYLDSLSKNGKTPEARIHALRTLEGMEALAQEQVQTALDDKDPAVREHAIQLAEGMLPDAFALAGRERARTGDKSLFERYFASSFDLAARLTTLADDSDSRVRFQCALSLGEFNDDTIIPALVKIAARNLDDKWTRAAVLTAITHRETRFLDAFLPVTASANSEGLPAFMKELGHILAAAAPPDKLAGLLGRILEASQPPGAAWQMAAVGGFGDSLRSHDVPTQSQSPLLRLAGNSELHQELDHLFLRSAQLGSDASQPMSARLAAIGLLGQAEYATAGKALEALINLQQPAEIQIAAVRALGRIGDPSLGPALVKRGRWGGYSPGVREAVLSALMTSPSLISSLLAAVEADDVPALTVTADRRNRLMKHQNEAIRTLATKLFKNMQPGDRMKAYEEAKAVLALKPDPANGRTVFQKNCTLCHVFAGEGKTVGPDLTGIRNQPSEVLLLHIVVPEYEINPIYTCYNVELKDGESFTGLLAAESPAAITLRLPQGVEQTIPRPTIASMTASRLSLMPQELEKAMTTQDLSDLIGFLKGM